MARLAEPPTPLENVPAELWAVIARMMAKRPDDRYQTAEGLLSVAVQHEMDHLLGKVFVDYLSPLKRSRIKTRMLKKTRVDARA